MNISCIYREIITGGAVIRYSPNSSVVPYFSENLPLYLINTRFPKNSQNPLPYRRPLPEPYRYPLPVPYNAPPVGGLK